MAREGSLSVDLDVAVEVGLRRNQHATLCLVRLLLIRLVKRAEPASVYDKPNVYSTSITFACHSVRPARFDGRNAP